MCASWDIRTIRHTYNVVCWLDSSKSLGPRCHVLDYNVYIFRNQNKPQIKTKTKAKQATKAHPHKTRFINIWAYVCIHDILFNTPEYGKFKIPQVIYVLNSEMNLEIDMNERILKTSFQKILLTMQLNSSIWL